MRVIFLAFFVASIIQQSCATASLSNNSNIQSSQNIVETSPDINESDSYEISPCLNSKRFRENLVTKKRAIEGGVLNQWATCGTVPDADLAALPSSGTANVEVLFDENGIVVSANSNEENKALAASVIRAAKSTQFKPIYLGGEAMRVRGVLMYKFARDRGFWLHKFAH